MKDLGFGDYDNIALEINRKQHQPCLFYESAILCKDGIATSRTDPTIPCTAPETTFKAGLLGWKTPDDALKALKSAPLLSDLKEWTQWTTVFEPCLGNLKLFIERETKSEIQALETSGKALLRIDTNTTNTTPDRFYSCVDENDVIGASGTLVSLVVQYGGIKTTPLTLITNHMRPALSKLASADHENGGFTCPQFVLQCLCRMPDNMCMALADKVFLEPLGFAVGTTNSCQLLLSCCTNDKQRSRLHRLGLGLGKSEWITDFESTITGEKPCCENEKRISLKELKPVAVVKPVNVEIPMESDTRQDSEEESTEDTESLSDSEQEIQDDTDSKSTSERKDEDNGIMSNSYKAIIDTIRKEEFGIGVVLGEEEEKLVQKQREREGRSLHRLSAELYNRDTHFVLELVQNADDNAYTDTETPALMFVVDSKRIMVLNNEVGFSEKNIRALCDVGKSTKGPHQYGYIGQKGIGFKSVFRISDTPEIHSNGYHIRFDANSGPSGYILPHWIGEETEENNDALERNEVYDDSEFDDWMTKIVLPLREEFHGDKSTSFLARFDDVHPSLLLFLHRLRRIVIVKDNDIQKMTRQDLNNGIIEINHSRGTDRWLVVKKQLSASNVREDVEMTELALAFPILDDKDSKNMASPKTLPKQNVFAYLPLRNYGFKFIIQGDFEVPSSREDVDGDKAWNQWLREEISKLFIDALEVFKQHPSFPGLSCVAKFFRFVPLEEEILDFFAPVASAILKYLQGIKCMPVEKSKDTENKGKNSDNDSNPKEFEWMQPCTVVVCDDPKVRAFITSHLLRKHLNLSYLAQEVASVINPALRVKLGVQTLSVKHIIDIGQGVLQDSASDGHHDVKWIAQWLHCIYRCLESEHNSSAETLNEIASMDIIPLSDNRLVNLKDHAVFFPLSVDATNKSKKKKAKASYLRDLECDLSVLHPDLLTHLGSVGHSLVEKLLKRLGVKSWTPNDVIHNHILPTLKSEKRKEKSPSILQSYLVYIFDQCFIDKNVCSMDELKACCQVLTNKGPVNPSKTPVHLTPRYGYELDLGSKLPSISWTLLDDSYLDLSTHHNVTKQDWEKFFLDLGVGHFLAIERKTTRLTKMNMSESPWLSYHKDWPETSDGCYIVEDYYCSELEEFMQKPNKDPNQARIIAENLDKLWANRYSFYAVYVPVKDTEGRELQKTFSSFWHNLREGKWFPVVSSPTCQLPRELFSNTDQLRGLLDEHVSYAGVKLEDESFISAIGLASSVSAPDLLKHLIEWSCKDGDQDNGFISSLAHMRRVYAFLHDNCSIQSLKSKITDAFQKNPLIFVPTESPKLPEKRVRGKFCSLKEVCWNDPSEVTQKLQSLKKYTPKRQILSLHYKESHDFLMLNLRVDATPHADEYIEMANVLVEESPFPTPSDLESILEIFAVLGEKCRGERHKPSYDNADFTMIEDMQINQSMANYLRGKLKQEPIFPCGERWVSLSERPIIPDNKQLKKIFEKEKNVHFITLECSSIKAKSRAPKKSKIGEEKKQNLVKVFLSACGIAKLSEMVEEELTPTTVEYQCHEIQQHFHEVVPCIQRYLYSHMEERYKELKEQMFGKQLSEMKFATVEKLEVVYRLKGPGEITVGQEIKYGSENVGQALHFYAIRQQSKSIESLNKAIAKLFIDGNHINFGNFLSSLSNKLDDGLENFLDEQEVYPLPENEKKWFVPGPNIPSSPETEIPDEFFPPPVQRKVRGDNDGEMYCWPPRSSVSGVKQVVRDNKPNQQKAADLWPQPEAPESMRNEPQSLEGSFISTGSHNTEKKEERTDNRLKQDPENIGASHKQALPPQNTPTVESLAQTPVIPNVDDSLQPALGDSCIGPSIETAANPSPDVMPSPMVTPFPSDGTILPVCSPVMQHLLSSTPRTAGGSPSIFSPSIHVPFEDLECEELPTESVALPMNVSLNDSSDKMEVGRRGEEFVYDYLNLQKPPDNRVMEMIWMNQNVNSTAPFDIQVTSKPVTGAGPETVTYIEVKSTLTDNKEYFEISVPELQFALEKRESLHLYRVFNVGSNQGIRILRVQNLAKHLERKSVKVFMVV